MLNESGIIFSSAEVEFDATWLFFFFFFFSVSN